jgi:hypothetical protein
MPIIDTFAPYQIPTIGVGIQGAGSATVDANGETCFTIGHVWIPGGGSKVLSAAGGGRIAWVTGAGVTFANASTDLRVGIQDVSAGAPDGTYDVYAGYVGGTDTIASTTMHRKAMTSGTKTIANRDKVAIGVTMVTRGGADSVSIDRIVASAQGDSLFPYGIANGTQSATIAPFLIVFDDGTVGWIHPLPLGYNMSTGETVTAAVNTGTTPDEYAMIVTFDTIKRIVGGGMRVGAVGAADAFELIFYSDPEGTPSALETIAFSGSGDLGGGDGLVSALLASAVDLAANTPIGIAIRPTSANSITVGFFDLTTGFEAIKKALPYATVKFAARSNQTGPFVETQTYHLPFGSVWVGGDADDTGGASSGAAQLVNGGLVS